MLEELIIQPYEALPCRLEKFIINTEEATVEEFGEMVNFGNWEDVEEYACGPMHFVPNENKKYDCMEKYCLTEEEYNTVIEQLQLALLLENGCGWCI